MVNAPGDIRSLYYRLRWWRERESAIGVISLSATEEETPSSLSSESFGASGCTSTQVAAVTSTDAQEERKKRDLEESRQSLLPSWMDSEKIISSMSKRRKRTSTEVRAISTIAKLTSSIMKSVISVLSRQPH